MHFGIIYCNGIRKVVELSSLLGACDSNRNEIAGTTANKHHPQYKLLVCDVVELEKPLDYSGGALVCRKYESLLESGGRQANRTRLANGVMVRNHVRSRANCVRIT